MALISQAGGEPGHAVMQMPNECKVLAANGALVHSTGLKPESRPSGKQYATLLQLISYDVDLFASINPR